MKYIDSFYKHMEADGNNLMQGGLTLPALTMFYRQLKSDLLQKKDNHKVHGTVEWRLLSGLDSTRHGDISQIEVKETGRYFCGREE